MSTVDEVDAAGAAETAGTAGTVWQDVVGQEAAVAQFRRAASPEGSLAQAWLITGPPGSGRSTAARAFAATLECERGTGCGRCHACRTVLSGTHPDVTAVATDKLSISKDEVRSLVMTAQRSPATGAQRVIIIEDADRMSAGTFNVLLKSIEEPPPHTVWMLCAPSAEDLASTIRSRCRVVSLAIPRPEQVAELLVRRDGADPALADRAARAAQGHIGLALRYATRPGELEAREESARTLLGLRSSGQAVLAAGSLVERANAEAAASADDDAAARKEAFLRSAGIEDGKIPPSLRGQMRQLEEDAKRRRTRLVRDVLDRYLLDAHSVLRDVLVVQLGTEADLVNPGVREEIMHAAQGGDPQVTLALLDAVQQARARIAGNVPPLLATEALLARIAVRSG
ncbi:DNA polymerase III subunit delta' [Brachybacterium endophyticum]|uniref:DNA polymerase III subunit delta n=1 Tax=Brachybacterium endophyticum TaxID=2182385 RepID=A0A2U2RL45_9MICO|nr:DNA polymerase III subunit delta' [Brachybacterium endophyticum]PWH06504.1 DNA polymerase III subunit delta' [Brachybacterium endophyticum]